MDSRIKKLISKEYGGVEECGFSEGFEFAIKRLRENKYYGHYATGLADWLEVHLTKEVRFDTAQDVKRDTNNYEDEKSKSIVYGDVEIDPSEFNSDITVKLFLKGYKALDTLEEINDIIIKHRLSLENKKSEEINE